MAGKSVRDSTIEDDTVLADSEFNIQRISEIQSCFPIGSQALSKPGRLYVREGTLQKMCRKGLKPRHFFLFNDILVYAIELARGAYTSQTILRLAECSLTDMGDTEDGQHCFQINHKLKSFQVFAPSISDKISWITNLKKYIFQCSNRDAETSIDARAVWVPDAKVSKCMVCHEREFTLLNRRHHCRKCGKVACGPCTSRELVLGKGKPERVCVVCYMEVDRSGQTNLPTNAASAGLGMTMTPFALARTQSNAGGPPQHTTTSVPSSTQASDSEDSSDDEERVGDRPVMVAPEKNNLSASEKKIHELTNEERLALMMAVKDGKMSIDAALAAASRDKKQQAADSKIERPERPTGATATTTASAPSTTTTTTTTPSTTPATAAAPVPTPTPAPRSGTNTAAAAAAANAKKQPPPRPALPPSVTPAATTPATTAATTTSPTSAPASTTSAAVTPSDDPVAPTRRRKKFADEDNNSTAAATAAVAAVADNTNPFGSSATSPTPAATTTTTTTSNTNPFGDNSTTTDVPAPTTETQAPAKPPRRRQQFDEEEEAEEDGAVEVVNASSVAATTAGGGDVDESGDVEGGEAGDGDDVEAMRKRREEREQRRLARQQTQ